MSLLPIAEGESVFQQEANYYLGIALVELGQTEQAKERLSNIDPSAKIYEKAKKLLDSIETVK